MTEEQKGYSRGMSDRRSGRSNLIPIVFGTAYDCREIRDMSLEYKRGYLAGYAAAAEEETHP